MARPTSAETWDALAVGARAVTVALLVLMALVGGVVIVNRLLQSLRIATEARVAPLQFFRAGTLGAATEALRPGSAFRQVADAAISASENHDGTLADNIDRNAWVALNVQRSLADIESRHAGGFAWLAAIGITAPLVGLFGTLVAAAAALMAVGVPAEGSLQPLAQHLGEALLSSALGLLVAVPALIGHRVLRRRNQLALTAVRRFGADLHAVLLGAPIAGNPPG